MATLQRVRVTWSGEVGLPGVNTFYYEITAAPPLADLRAFYNSMAALLPAGTNVQVENSGDTITDTTGAINGSWSAAAVAVVVGTDASAFASPVGAVVNWLTGAIVAGRRLRGRSFIVPLGGTTQAVDGSIDTADLTTIRTAAATLAGIATPHYIWHRPTTPGGSDGSSAVVSSSSVPDKFAVLRSRRD